MIKKGRYKWKGIYNGDTPSFNMKSLEFKTKIQAGQIEFKNGSAIKCHLQIKKKINNEGIEEEVDSYNILRVDEYFENDTPVQAAEGKAHKRK